MVVHKKLGYYTCGGLDFESKLHAFIYSKQVNKPVDWIFNDDVFRKFDWTVEPEESLDTLYDRRARELREQYDYLILSYSGGSDSHNILMSFIRQGLHLDEIVVNSMEKGSRKFTVNDTRVKENWNINAEHELQTMPRLKEVSQLIPRTKITILDLTDHVIDTMNSADEDWIMNKKERLNPVGITRFNYIHFSEVRKKFDKDKKIALIQGLEKPKCLIKDNMLYIRFVDKAANITTIIDHFREYPNSTVELFYWDPSCTRMMAKQGHVIKHYLTLRPELRKFWDVRTTNHRIALTLHERLLRSILYTTWDDSWFQVEKPISDWFCEYDDWFIKGMAGTRANEIWHRGISYVKDSLSEFIRTDDKGNPDGLQSFVKEYCLGPMPVILTA